MTLPNEDVNLMDYHVDPFHASPPVADPRRFKYPDVRCGMIYLNSCENSLSSRCHRHVELTFKEEDQQFTIGRNKNAILVKYWKGGVLNDPMRYFLEFQWYPYNNQQVNELFGTQMSRRLTNHVVEVSTVEITSATVSLQYVIYVLTSLNVGLKCVPFSFGEEKFNEEMSEYIEKLSLPK